MKTITPNLMVKDVPASVAFYRDYLGFTLVMAVPASLEGVYTELSGNEVVVYALVKNGAVELMFQAEESLRADIPGFATTPVGASLCLYLQVENLAALHAAIAPHVEIVKPLGTTWYGMQEFYVRDNNGYVLCFAEPAHSAGTSFVP